MIHKHNYTKNYVYQYNYFVPVTELIKFCVRPFIQF